MEMVKRGEIYYADLSPVVGSEQGGVRPVLVVQNNVGNRYSPTVIAAAITSQLDKAKLPTHIAVPAEVCGLPRNSVVLLEQIRTIDKKRLGEKIGELPSGMMARVNEALLVSLGFSKPDPAARAPTRISCRRSPPHRPHRRIIRKHVRTPHHRMP